MQCKYQSAYNVIYNTVEKYFFVLFCFVFFIYSHIHTLLIIENEIIYFLLIVISFEIEVRDLKK